MVRTVLLAALALTGCKRTLAPEPEDVWRFGEEPSLGAIVQAAARTPAGRLWVAVEEPDQDGSSVAQLAMRDGDQGVFTYVSRGDLPPGTITWLGAHDASRQWVFAQVHGKGFFRSWAGSGTWERIELRSALLEILSPLARPIPTDLAVTSEGVLWLATLGGLYFSSDEGATWTQADTSSSGNTNLVFTGIDARDDRVVAVSALPDSLIPSEFDGIVSGRVFVSETSGLTWSVADEGFPSQHPSSVAIAEDGTLHVGTMDRGIVRGGAGAWTALAGPSDVRDVTWARDGLNVASATRGLWRLEDDVWTAVGGATPGAMVQGNVGLLRDGQVFTLEQGLGEAGPDPANGRVHIALSFHVNYYHSYRGDSNDEDGFGRDIRIIRGVLDWLDARPEVRADWDLENAFSTDAWMPSYSPDVLERIQQRVSAGSDDVRLMSWNNGAMASSNRAEFREAIQRAWQSNQDLFDEVVPGVQPQENMFSPDHIGWYAEEGIDWVTLFYSANGFTGPRHDLPLNGSAAHNPVSLRDPATNETITMVPVYHHADLLDHGGLAGWARQLSAAHAGDTLLVIHFDADGDSWERFDRELDAAADLPFIEWTKLSSYLDDHGPVAEFTLHGDIADGVGDGFSSWAEKSVNHEIWTEIERSRRLVEAASSIGAQHNPTQLALPTTVEPRLRALSTTHFGLATPELHPDREASARDLAHDAVISASNVLALAESARPLQPFTLEVVQTRDASGLGLVPFQLRLPAGVWEGEAGLSIDRAGAPLLLRAFLSHTDGEEEVIDVFARLQVPGPSIIPLTFQYDPGEPSTLTGSLTAADVPTLPLLRPPFAECAGVAQIAAGGPIASEVDPLGRRAARIEEWRLPTCTGLSDVRRTLSRIDGFPGVVVDVQATIDPTSDPGALESLALTPLACPGGVASLRWRSFGGSLRTRDVPRGIEAWNPVSADGWIEATCTDGQRVQMSVDTTLRASMGLLSLRNDGGDGLLAPMGTLWGDGRWHDAQRTGGTGLGDHVTPVVGSQFTPSAPNWIGEVVRYRLWITEDEDPEALDLFAHPPYVRVPSTP